MAVRSALVSRLERPGGAAAHDIATSTPAMGFSTPIDMQSSITDISSLSYPMSSSSSIIHETPIAVSTLRPSNLDKIQEFLLRGDRQSAYHYALDEKLWAHAMVIASSIDKEAWKEAVNEFLKSDLGAREDTSRVSQTNSSETVSKINGRESLRVAYSMFSGQGAAAGVFSFMSPTVGILLYP
jgi:COPII coat assembly protein SEC16